MRTHATVLSLFLASICSAQLINGSFEENGAFSLTGWEWTCDAPEAIADPPPDAGLWSASKRMGDPFGCDSSYIFQRIPFALSGESWKVGGWLRSESPGWGSVPRFGFSSVRNGVFNFQSQVGNQAPYWSYCWIIDTVHANATDTAVVLLTCGSTNGGVNASGWFDGFTLEPALSTGMNEPAIPVHTFLDADQLLHVATEGRTIRSAEIIDAAGRTMNVAALESGPGSATWSVRSLNTGIYIVRLNTDRGPAAVRFLKP